ncbi:MAG TPA: zf-HC2 domain-containing protein [Terriglobales bacterium]|nr:zf-HC2 domain-containing protein [Terriglobales bacterium]
MAADHKNGMQCNEFDALLSDALDQRLTGDQLERFQAHARGCPTCGPLLAEADAGLRWLHELVEVDPPVNLVHNILAATSGFDTAHQHGTATAQTQISWFERLQALASAVVNPILGVAKQPRFAMSFGMAFFSLSITMSMAGVKLGDLRHVDLRPSAIKRSYYETSGRLVKYYENIRFVYELESRVREFKRATMPAEPTPQEREREEEEKDKHRRNDNTSGQPEPRQDRNYSQEGGQVILASLTDKPPVVILATHRRFS